MTNEECPRCGTELPIGASFCPTCGANVGGGATRAQVLAVAVILLELGAMVAIWMVVVPRGASLFTTGAPRSDFTRIVFSSWWMPAWMIVVAVLGAISVFAARTNVLRTVLVSMCLLIGLVPIIGTTMGLYVATIEAANADAR